MRLTCIHSPAGLCSRCREEFEADPSAYVEFGDHTAGLRRWAELQAEIAADRAEAERQGETEIDWTDVPF